VVRVRVLEVDLARKRIALSLRPEGSAGAVAAPAERRPGSGPSRAQAKDQRRETPTHTALAAAFARVGEGRRK
jgi:transcriptional accessory protein Tex/SPT6